ncbi:MAG: hypothetical protein JWO87_3756 [Phycisphaerales bacterium]|nr:hypothetical protein [Phycisphaerales bacterium]
MRSFRPPGAGLTTCPWCFSITIHNITRREASLPQSHFIRHRSRVLCLTGVTFTILAKGPRSRDKGVPMSQFQTVPCLHCGASYQLTSDYIAQYGGQATICRQCQQPFQIPAALPAAGGASPVPVLAYSGPVYTPTWGVWREDKKIVASKGAVLPSRCVKCNGPAGGSPITRTLYWHHPALYLLILPGILIYAIVALIVRQSGTVTVCLCNKHRSQRIYAILGGWLGALLGIVCLFYAAVGHMPELFVPLGIVLFLTSIIAGVIIARIVTPSRIDAQYLWIRGAGPEFLNTLPDARGPVPGA